MKTIEEKAKAYDEIIERAKTMLAAGEVMYGKDNNASQLITDIIPDLKESEDERIRKWLVAQMQKFHDEANREGCWEDFCMTEKAIFYLEKQKEHSISAVEVLARAGLKPYKDGNQWCILAGDNIQDGICGFGDTIEDALYEFLKEILDLQKEQRPIEFKNDELVEIIKGEFEGFRRLLKKKGIDYEPQYGYWEGFARLFDSSAREYVKEQKEQKPIRSCDIVPYIDDKIAALQDMWREEKVAFDWDDMHEMIEDVARHFYQQEQKPAEWNDTDMKEARDSLISVCRDWEYGKQTTLIPLAAVRARYFLEHLNEPKPAEWSVEDERILKGIIGKIDHDQTYGVPKAEMLSFLTRLRPSWKPSEEQIYTLERICSNLHLRASDDAPKLDEIIEQLKKLM